MEKLDKKNIEDILALTPMQEGMLFHYLKDPASPLYFGQLCLDISGQIQTPLFRRAWDVVIENNEMMRTLFRWDKLDSPTQVVLKKHTPDIRFHDLSSPDEALAGAAVREIKIKDMEEAFDLQNVPFRVTLIKSTQNRRLMIISNHHILYDGWSHGIILGEFFRIYHDLHLGKTVGPTVKTKFREYIRWIGHSRRREGEPFWSDYLNGFGQPVELSVKSAPDETITPSDHMVSQVDSETRQRLESFARRHQLTFAALLYSAWGLLLQRYNNTRDVIFGTTVSGRNADIKEIENIVGLFINTPPLPVRTYPREKTLTWLQRINQSLEERLSYETDSLVKIKQYSQLKSFQRLFDTIVVIENYPLTPDVRLNEPAGGLVIDSLSSSEMTNYDLTLGIKLFDTMELDFSYNPRLLEKNTLRALSVHFIRLLKEIALNTPEKVDQIEMLPPEEKNRILIEFNDTAADYPRNKTIPQLFEEQAEQDPDRVAVVEAGNSNHHLTYRELNAQANGLALHLTGKGVEAGSIVAIMMERSIELIIGMIGILKAGGVYLPIDSGYPEERVRYMLGDSGASILLKSEIRNPKSETNPNDQNTNVQNKNHCSECVVLNFEHFNFEFVSDFGFRISDLSYVIYTSGTTGKPKGALIRHQGLINMISHHRKVFHEDSSSRFSQSSGVSFDAMAFEVWPCLTVGAVLCIVDAGTRIDPWKLKEWILRYHITLSFQPTLMARRLLEEPWPPARTALKALRTAGDKLTGYLTCPYPFRFYNLYGPTEDTIWTTWTEVRTKPEGMVKAPPIGKPIANKQVYILGPGSTLQPIGVAGELCIGGDGLAVGYLNQPELTFEKFQLNSTLYKTGDLARWLPDGNIQFIGRVDHQVKIRGFRIELGEIETLLAAHPQVKETAAVATDGETGDKYICAYIVLKEGELSTEDLHRYLAPTLPEYMIPSYFVFLDEIPLTPNGKTDTHALPRPSLTPAAGHVPPATETETKLARIWSQLLGFDKEAIGVDDNFFQVGGHSLNASILISKIHKELDVKVPLAHLFESPTIRGLAQRIQGAGPERHHDVEPVEKRDYYPMSPPQKRLYITQTMDVNSRVYNMPQAFFVAGAPRLDQLETACRALIRRHENLRTSFEVAHDEPVQRVHDHVDFSIVPLEYAEARAYEIVNDFVKPFDLAQAPLMRMALVKSVGGPHRHLLIVDMHHIISDGTSMAILAGEFRLLSEGKTPPPLTIHYKDYSQWQNSRKQREKVKVQEEFWLREFRGELPVLDLFTDYSRPPLPGYEGGHVDFFIPPPETEALNILALQEEATLYMVLLSVYYVLLYKLTLREDIIIGAPTAGRGHADIQTMPGMFLNMLPIRNFPRGKETFTRFLGEVKEKVLETFEHQGYHFEELVNRLGIKKNAGRNPLFDVMFLLQNMEIAPLKIPGLKPEPFDYSDNTTKFDLGLIVGETGRELHLQLNYSTKLFKRETIELLSRYFKHIVATVLAHPRGEVARVRLIPKEHRRALIDRLNDDLMEDARPVMQGQTVFQEALDKHLINYRHRAAVEYGDQTVSYGELDRRSRYIAHWLRDKGIKKETTIGILMDDRISMIIAMLGILKAGCAFVPLDPSYPGHRLKIMIRSGIRLIISDAANDDHIKIRDFAVEQAVAFFLLEDLYPDKISSWDADQPDRGTKYLPGDKVYLYFTSGTTGEPKAVTGKNIGLLHYILWEVRRFSLDEQVRFNQFSPFGFDAFLKEVFVAFFAGGTLCIPPALEPLLEPHRLAAWLETHRIGLIHCVPGIFRLLNPAKLTAANFPHLKYILLAGEEIHPADLAVWFQTFDRRIQICNLYGLTETTIVKTCHPIRKTDIHRTRIPIGRAIPGSRAIILDQNRDICAPLVKGEIYLRTPFTSYGYGNDSPLNKEKFIPNPFNPNPSKYHPGDTLYRTGDLGRLLPDGSIETLGRIDRQIKLRGMRIELDGIQRVLSDHPSVREAAVIKRGESEDHAYLCAYVTPTRTFQPETPVLLKNHLTHRLPAHMVPAHIVTLEKLPLTPNGKIDRNALPDPVIRTRESFAVPRDPLERKLAGIWAGVLTVDMQTIGSDDNFFQLGGHSLRATIVVSKIHKALNVKVPLAELFRTPTIRELAAAIRKTRTHQYASIEPVELKEYYPLSSAQKRLYFLYHMDKQSTGYNMSFILPVHQDIEKDKLEKALTKLVARHESLRTSFIEVKGMPVQVVHPNKEILIEEAPAVESFIRPFDLGRAPLIRIGLIKGPGHRFTWAGDMHHIISDGTSCSILQEEFLALYAGGDDPLPPVRVRYKDFARWQNRLMEDGTVKLQEEWWHDQYKDSARIPRLDLPTDYKRPGVFNHKGDRFQFQLPPEDVHAPGTFDSGTNDNGTLFMHLMAALNVLFYKYTLLSDIVIGAGISGRPHDDLQDIIGMFVNTLAMRNRPQGEQTYETFLKEVIRNSIDAFENQDVQFESLLEKLDIERNPSRNPLFDICMMVQNFRRPAPEIQELSIEYKRKTTRFDMTFFIHEQGENINITIEYYSAIFNEATIRRLASHFKNVIATVSRNPAQRLNQIAIISQAERNRVIYEFNNTQFPFQNDKTIHQCFEEQAQRTPGRVAVIIRNSSLTYLELNRRANQPASVLTEKGVRPGMMVGIMMERCLEMIIGLFGILKAGAAYLPIDPDYPRERIDFMLKDSGSSILLNRHTPSGPPLNEATLPPLSRGEFRSVEIMELPGILNSPLERGTLKYEGGGVSKQGTSPNGLAYIIYTSGSTGKPKGVLIEHRSLVNRLQWMQNKYPLDASDTILQKTTFTFDVSVWELFWWSIVGARLCLLEPGGEKDPGLMVETIERNKVTVMHFVPSMLNIFLDYLKAGTAPKVSTLKQVFSSGEELTLAQVKIFEKLLHDVHSTQLANLYGPTEATIDVSYFDCFPHDTRAFASIPIGKPIYNTRLYILDTYLHPQPVGVVGELCIGGVGLARGYLNRPEMTHTQFGITNETSKIYRTGDLVRWLADGNIQFLGRIDNQVKIRGFRIELEEIEHCFLHHEAIKEAVVIIREDAGTGKREKSLCACLVSDRELDVAALKAHLSRRLPGYMVPSLFKKFDRLPLTRSGKLDRQVLGVSGSMIQGGVEYIAPGTDTQIKIARIWKEILGAGDMKVGIDDNFFDLGGTSMDVIRVNREIAREFEKEIPVVALYKYTTAGALADLLDHGERPDENTYSQGKRVDRIKKGRLDKTKMRQMRRSKT
ncbi:MAG: amino acid adenylation domain-containing protein [bacterium]|nr:amino acid adenylation domain-containing protein [bacterium]